MRCVAYCGKMSMKELEWMKFLFYPRFRGTEESRLEELVFEYNSRSRLGLMVE